MKNIKKHLENLTELAQSTTDRYEDGTEYNIYDLKELMAKELQAIEDIGMADNTEVLEDNQLNLNIAQTLSEISADYLSDLEDLAFKFEKERSRESAIALAWETNRDIKKLVELNYLMRETLTDTEQIVNEFLNNGNE